MNRRSFLKLFGLGTVGAVATVAIPMPALKEKPRVLESPNTKSAFTFTNDSDVGMYRPEGDRICVTFSGVRI